MIGFLRERVDTIACRTDIDHWLGIAELEGVDPL